MAVAETAIALALILGVFMNLTSVLGVLLTVVIWSTAEGFGGPYQAGSTDIGAAVIYALVFAGLFLSSAGLYFGLDRPADAEARKAGRPGVGLVPDACRRGAGGVDRPPVALLIRCRSGRDLANCQVTSSRRNDSLHHQPGSLWVTQRTRLPGRQSAPCRSEAGAA